MNEKFRSSLLILSLVLSQFIYVYQINLMYPCFIFGVFLNKYWNTVKSKSIGLTVITGITFILMIIPWNQRFWIIPTGGIYPLQNIDQYIDFLGPFYYRMFIGIVGSLFFIMLCELICSKLPERKIIDRLSSIGQITLGIYLLQTIIIEILLWRWFKFDESDSMLFGFIIAPIFSVMVLLICMIGIRILKMNKYSALLFLGERE